MDSITVPAFHFKALEPVLIVSVAAVLLILADLFVPRRYTVALAFFGFLSLGFAGCDSGILWLDQTRGAEPLFFSAARMLVLDKYSLFLYFIILFGAGLTVLLSINYLVEVKSNHAEYYALVLFATVGMMLMVASTDLIMIFIALEVMSIPIYVLAGFSRTRPRSNESALKYFLLGAFASGLFLYGVALLYGAYGTVSILDLGGVFSTRSAVGLAGLALLLVGFGFKISSVPFHMWTPDVYEGAPTPITAFMSVGVKAAAFGAFLRVLATAFDTSVLDWTQILWWGSVITMTLGNIAALVQTNIKRMLAYSSIAHVGYILIGIVAGGEAGMSAVLFYLMAYAFMTLGAFGVVIYLTSDGEDRDQISDLSGLAGERRFLAFAMLVFLVSLAGIPPTAGFMAKFYIFGAAVESGHTGLAVIGVLNSVVSIYYYFYPVVVMYMRKPIRPLGWAAPATAGFVSLVISFGLTIWAGVAPSWFMALARESIRLLI